MSTSVTIEADGITAKLTIDEDELKFEDFMENLIEPAILAAGYSRKLLDEWFTTEND